MKERLIELIEKAIQGSAYSCDVADFLLENGVVVVDEAIKEAVIRAINSLSDMVNQFGYSTTFRRKEAVCDGGLSALEEAFYALELCGARVNSNGTINRENLVNYKIENVIKEHMEAKDNV